MFSFYWPWFAILLVVPFLVGLFWLRSRQDLDKPIEGNQSTLLHPSLNRLTHAFTYRRRLASRTGRLHLMLLLILWIALVLAMMRPQWLEPHKEVKTEGYDLMLAVDASRSMGALDFSVNAREVTRMAVIKGVLGRFVASREGDRVGLIVFGDQAYVLTPLTQDVQAVRNLVDTVVPSIVGDATAMGDAIGLAVKKLRERPEGSRVLVLVTDGESTAGSLPPMVAARLAAVEGIRIYTIGVGSKGLVPFYENGRRRMVRMEIDEDLLRKVASLTGGSYFRATDANALEKIYRQIDSLEKTEAETRSALIPHPLFHWPLGLALITLFVLGLFPEGKWRHINIGEEHA